MNIRDSPEDFIHLSDFRFVIEIHGSVEVRNLAPYPTRNDSHQFIRGLAQNVALGFVNHVSKLWKLRKGDRAYQQHALEDPPQYLFCLQSGLHGLHDILHGHL